MPKPNRIQKSLKASFIDGLFASGMMGLITDYITPYALLFKATTGQIGILSAVPNLISSLAQIKAPDLTEKLGGRRSIIGLFVFLQACMFVPVIFIPLLFPGQAVVALIVCVTLFISLGAFAGPAWASLMSDYIPVKKRGKYFGWRNKIMGIVTVTSACLAGLLLHMHKARPLHGFMIIFSAAFLARMVSWYFLTRMYEPKLARQKGSYFSIFDFVLSIRESNFAKFVFFVAAFNFSVQLAAPFFSVFMLRDLKFGYLTYTVLAATVTLAHIFAIDRWGNLADKTGNVKVIRFTALIIAANPLLWLLNRHPLFLICCQFFAGFAWAGFMLCCTNFIYDAVTPAKRIRCIAYFNLFGGLGSCFGALTGGFLINSLPVFQGFKILSLFVIAGILRFAVAFFLSGQIKEVRSTEKISSRDLFYGAIGIKPIFDSAQDSRRIGSPES